MEIRVSGRAKKEKTSTDAMAKKPAKPAAAAVPPPAATAAMKPPPSTPKAELSGEELQQDTQASFEEMEDIMNQMGLGDDAEEEEEDDEDDDIDLT